MLNACDLHLALRYYNIRSLHRNKAVATSKMLGIQNKSYQQAAVPNILGSFQAENVTFRFKIEQF